MEYGLRIYRAPGSPAEILMRYDREMESHGWERILADGDRPRRVYGRAGVHVFALPRIEDERTLVSLVQMRGR